MSNNIWRTVGAKILPSDTTQQVTSFADFGVNAIFAWFFFKISPGVFTALVSLILTFAAFGIAFSIPKIGESAAQLKSFVPVVVLFLAVLCSICMSTVSLNSSVELISQSAAQNGSFKFSDADINLGFVYIAGDIAISYMCIFLAVMLSVVNGALPFIRTKAGK